MRYPPIFITAGLICLVVGEGFGLWMGKTGDFVLAPAHAHLNLVGWASLALFGLVHHAFPVLAQSRLAALQCALAIIGAIVLPIGIGYAILSTGALIAIAGSVATILATLLFVIMFMRRVALAKAPA